MRYLQRRDQGILLKDETNERRQPAGTSWGRHYPPLSRQEDECGRRPETGQCGGE